MGSRTFVILAAVLLGAMAGVAVFSFLSMHSTDSLEGFSQVTAAGDTQFFSPSTVQPGAVIAWNGRNLVLANNEKVKIDDTRMRRIFRDARTGLMLYSPMDKNPAGEFFVKIAVGEFLPLRDGQ